MARKPEKLHPVTQYAEDIGAGRIAANKMQCRNTWGNR